MDNEVIEIPEKKVSFHKLSILGEEYTQTVCVSEEGYISFVLKNSIISMTIGRKPFSISEKYVFNEYKWSPSVQKATKPQSAIDFCFDPRLKVIQEQTKDVPDTDIINILLDSHYNDAVVDPINVKSEVSPLDFNTKKSIHAVLKSDGSLHCLVLDKRCMKFVEICNVSSVLIEYVKSQSQDFTNMSRLKDFVTTKNRLRPVDMCWSSNTYDVNSNKSIFLLSVLLQSAELLFFVIDHIEKKCVVIHKDDTFASESGKLSMIKVCSINEFNFIIASCTSNGHILLQSYKSQLNKDFPFIKIQKTGGLMKITYRITLSPCNQIEWSSKFLTLLVGFQSELMRIQFITNRNKTVELKVRNTLFSVNGSIKRILISETAAYLLLDNCYIYKSSLVDDELITKRLQIDFRDKYVLCDGFFSSNKVYLALVTHPNQPNMYLLKSRPNLNLKNLILIRLKEEDEICSIMCDDSKPFCIKQDVVEELRLIKRFKNFPSIRHIVTKPLLKHDIHELQYALYKYGFIENVLTKQIIENIKFMLIMRNVFCRIDDFLEIEESDMLLDDCLFVLGILGRLRSLPENFLKKYTDNILHVSEAYELIQNVLLNRFQYNQDTVYNLLDSNRLCCKTCNSDYKDLITCEQGHKDIHCVKSLVAFDDTTIKCDICGSYEFDYKIVELSDWRHDFINSNCPICDGHFMHDDIFLNIFN